MRLSKHFSELDGNQNARAELHRCSLPGQFCVLSIQNIDSSNPYFHEAAAKPRCYRSTEVLGSAAAMELALQEGRWRKPVAGLHPMQTPTMKGTVYIMGAGSGDPEPLSAQAVRILRTAEVVLHDDSVSSQILDLLPASTQVRNIHKLAVEPERLHEKIHSLLISAAREGHLVVRLIASDEAQAGHADATAEALAQAGVNFEVISSTAIAMGAAAGVNSH